MGRWTRENDFDALVQNAVDSVANVLSPWPMPKDQVFAMLKALIGTESAFDPRAHRGEVQLNDASHGLMQLLYATAQGVGYPGPRPTEQDRQNLTGLYAPATNIYIGAKLLRNLLSKTGGDMEAAWSAYNGGFSPRNSWPYLGFGNRTTAQSGAGHTACLARDAAGKCIQPYTPKAGEFANQPYIEKMKINYAYFFRNPPIAGDGQPVKVIEKGSHAVSTPLILGLLGALGGLLILRRKRGSNR